MIASNEHVALGWEATGSGDPILLIHGLGYARWGWGPLLSALAARHRVISFDNRGIGESSVPDGPYTAAEMAGDALAVMDAAGVARAHVIGTSLGGMIAQELAIAHPDRIDRLALLCTTPGATLGYPMPQQTMRLIAEAPSLPPAEALRRFVENALGPSPDAEIVATILRHRLAAPQDPAGWAAQAAAGTTYDGAERVRTINASTLVMAGTDDMVVDPRNSTVLAEHIPNATLTMIPDTGHLFFWEQPDLVADVILGHLA